MTTDAEDWLALNRANWDERVGIHLASAGYDVASLRDGRSRLDAIVDQELGAVEGLRVLHLQCHFGKDSFLLARRGAMVTGVDFSGAAIAAGRALAGELALPVRFVGSTVQDAPAALDAPGGFDLVYVTWGAICWLPDLAGWARVIAHFLRPGGALYFADAHPFAYMFDDMAGTDAQGRPGWFAPYFDTAALVLDDPADYADPAARLANQHQVSWMHTMSELMGALSGAGLRLDWLHEHPRIAWQMFRTLVPDADGLWTWPDRPWLPLALSLRAVKD